MLERTTEMSGVRGERWPPRLRVAIALAVAAAITVLALASAPIARGQGGICTKRTVEVGIVNAVGCWRQSTNSTGDTIYTAAFGDQARDYIGTSDEKVGGVDLNGFVLTGSDFDALQINARTREVDSIRLSTGKPHSVQLNSLNWPNPGLVYPMGSSAILDFVAPMNSSLLLQDLQMGSNQQISKGLGLLSPVGGITTLVMLEPGGTGSMDLTVNLAGIFTLKGRPQSVTIALPTKSGKGTQFDGFTVSLQQIDAINAIKIYHLEAKYSARTQLIAGSLNLGFPFFKEGVGVGGSFALQNGVLTELGVNVSGTKIPIGGAGVLTDLAGGFRFAGVVRADFNGYCKSIGYESGIIVGPDKGKDAFGHWKCHKGSTNAGIDVTKACVWQTGNPSASGRYSDPNDANSWNCVGASPSMASSFDLSANARLGANFGPEVPSPFGNLPPIRADAALAVGYVNGQLRIAIRGGVEIFRLPVGDVYLVIHSTSGVEFGVGLGIGFPSYRNNENDPFYIGARVDGWVSNGKFQLEGKGRVALAGFKIFDGHILVNTRAAGACWTVLGVPGGAVYEYGATGVRTFGIGCGLNDYREQFPGGLAASASQPRTFRLTDKKTVLAVKGVGAAPRFTLRSAAGRIIRTPLAADSAMTADYAVFVNEYTKTTDVVLPRARGTWTITPYPRSATITSVEAARISRPDRVTANVLGTGTTRTLVFHALPLPDTRLQFLEVLPNGQQIPVLNTAAASGRYQFRPQTGSGYGTRKLRVEVIQGYGFSELTPVARYQVNPPSTLPAPRTVSSRRDNHTVYVSWSGVRGASGYLVQTRLASGATLEASFVRSVSARTRSISVADYPDGEAESVASVYALNSDGALGKPARHLFATSPTVRTLKAASRLSARSARKKAGAVVLRTQCPAQQGHCQVRIELRLNGRVIVRAAYQQVPDTFQTQRMRPSKLRDRQALRQAVARRDRRLRVVVEMYHLSEKPIAVASAAV